MHTRESSRLIRDGRTCGFYPCCEVISAVAQNYGGSSTVHLIIYTLRHLVPIKTPIELNLVDGHPLKVDISKPQLITMVCTVIVAHYVCNV
jgi:hypothetical protein